MIEKLEDLEKAEKERLLKTNIKELEKTKKEEKTKEAINS